MFIHHATARRAKDNGIEIAPVEFEGGEVAAARLNGAEIRHPDPKFALNGMMLQKSLHLEYPGFTIGYDLDCRQWTVSVGGDELMRQDECPELADILEAAQDAGIDPEDTSSYVGGEEDEAEPVGDIVSSKYRAKYKEQGDPASCGDWLANVLNEECRRDRKEGGFDLEKFRAILENNDIDHPVPPLAKQSRGWQGRYRMTGRLRLELVVAKAGKLVLSHDDQVLGVPADELQALRSRHKKHFKGVA